MLVTGRADSPIELIAVVPLFEMLVTPDIEPLVNARDAAVMAVIPDNAPAEVSTAVEWALTVPELVPDVINELQVT
jgi:hypothetical protein